MGQLIVSLNPSDFMYGSYFPTLASGIVQEMINEIYNTWTGITELWGTLGSAQQLAKQNQLFNYLVAWHAVDMLPNSFQGAFANPGGIPLTAKHIGATKLIFKPIALQPDMEMLMSNVFGAKALQMIMACPERFGMRGSATQIFADPNITVPPIGNPF